jgi:hypothetical protein
MRRHEAEGCAAEAFLCPCGVPACALHGHMDVGDDPYCPHWLWAEMVCPRICSTDLDVLCCKSSRVVPIGNAHSAPDTPPRCYWAR